MTICLHGQAASEETAQPIPTTTQQLGALPERDLFKKNVILSTFIDVPTHSILISTSAGRANNKSVDQRVQYNPTVGPNVGVRGTYDFWSASFTKRLSLISQQETQVYGRSDYEDWRAGYDITENFSFEMYYQNYRGFYTDLSGQEGLQTSFDTEGSQTAAAPRGEKKIINRPDISSLNYGLRLTALFPLNSMFEGSSSQAGLDDVQFNLLSKIYYNRQSLKGDQPLVPESTSNSLSPIASLTEYWSNSLGLGIGLGVIFKMSERVHMGFDAMLGPGFQRQTNVFRDRESVHYTTSQEMNANFYTNWKSENHGFRAGLYMDALNSKVEDIHIDTSSLGLGLTYSYYGLRL